MIDDVAKSSHSAGTYFSGLVLIVLLLDLLFPSPGFFFFPPIKPLTMSHTELIKRHLDSGRPITPLEALNKYGCLRLAARISDLRNAGMTIRTDIVKTKQKRFAKYVKA